MALFTSKNNIIKITIFMENFLGISYDGHEKLTHDEMRQFLLEKGKHCPKRAVFSHVTEEDILTGNIILVKDENGKKIGYYNPYASFSLLLQELKESIDPTLNDKVRKEILKEQNCIELFDGNVVSCLEDDSYDEEDYQFKTRNKQYVFTKRARVVRRK